MKTMIESLLFVLTALVFTLFIQQGIIETDIMTLNFCILIFIKLIFMERK